MAKSKEKTNGEAKITVRMSSGQAVRFKRNVRSAGIGQAEAVGMLANMEAFKAARRTANDKRSKRANAAAAASAAKRDE